MDTKNSIIDQLKSKIGMEADALYRVRDQVDEAYVDAINMILTCSGSVILTGLGKTGHVAKKIAATFASLGTKAFYVHSCESLHGDMGMIGENDVVIMLSNSGNSSEILGMLKPLKVIGAKTISITKSKSTPLARHTDIALVADAGAEIDHLNLAPTTSSTAALAIGDALATVVSEMKGFTKRDFALSHPGGALGQLLLTENDRSPESKI